MMRGWKKVNRVTRCAFRALFRIDLRQRRSCNKRAFQRGTGVIGDHAASPSGGMRQSRFESAVLH